MSSAPTAAIVSVEISDWCYETYPCQHDIKITYTDGSVRKELRAATEILEKYKEYLSANDLQHFSYLKAN